MALTILNYGKTRTFKTSQAGPIAEYVYRRWKKRTRFVTTDVGSMWEPVQSHVDAGLIQPLYVPSSKEFKGEAIWKKLARGAWPVDITNNQLKEGSKWVEWKDQKESAEVGAYVFESLSSIGMGLMRGWAESNLTVGNASVPGFRTVEGETFGQNTENHYGMILTAMPAFLNDINMLPIEIVYTTSWDEVMEPRDKDIQKVYRLGPMLPGRKLIDIVPGSVNMLVHSMVVTDGPKSEVRCYIKNHPWEVLNKYQWPAGLRLDSSNAVLSALDKRWPEGYFVPSREKGIGVLLEFRDEMRELASAELKKKLQLT